MSGPPADAISGWDGGQDGGPRLNKLSPADLDADQRALYDAIAGGARAQGPQAFRLTDPAGGLVGPFNAMLLSPVVGAALQALGSAVRFGTEFSARGREIAILAVAHHWHSDFEIHAHEAVGRSVGLTEADLQALREDCPERLADPLERLIAGTARALVAGRDLDDEQYAAALQHLGAAVLFELSTLVGYYSTLALQLRVFRVEPTG